MTSTSLTSGYLPVTLYNTVDSSSITTGTLIVNGGVGIAKKLFIGDSITNNVSATFTITGGTSNFVIQPNATNGNISLVTTGTGRANVSFDPVAANDIANKNYVDRSRIFTLSFATSSSNYVQVNSSATYTAVADFIFPGTSVIGTPTAFLIEASMSATNANRFMRWRIFDVTNALVVCTSASTNSSTMAIINMGVISNVPSGQAIFQIQQQDLDNTDTPNTHATNGRVASFYYR
jgi:hypothetical protein